MAPQSMTDLMETVHTQLGVSLWLVMGWLKAVTVVNELEQNMLVFIKLRCKIWDNFNANSKYCFSLRTLASDRWMRAMTVIT